MKIEIHKLKQMFVLIPTIGMDAEYRCLFFVWLNRAIYLGKGKENSMDYEKKYKDALKKFKEYFTPTSDDIIAGGISRELIEDLFPELQEGKDERIRKAIKYCIKQGFIGCGKIENVTPDECLAWLEKQLGWQKQEESTLKCEPFRIKKGEWYVCIHDFCNKAIRIGEIIQAEHDDTIRGFGFLYMENKYFRPAFENEIPQKSKWTEEDEERLQSCISSLQGKGLMGGVDTINSK